MKLSADETQAYYDQNPLARRLALWVITVTCFVAALGLSASLVAIPTIARDLQADAVYTSWIPFAYLIANLVTLLPAGKLADLYGRKRVLFIGNIVFMLATLCVGLAPTIEVLLFFRVLQGIGTALLFGPSAALISTIFRGHGRGAALGWFISGIYTGLSAGPLLGGLITDQLGWPAVFLLPVPLTLLATLLGWWQMKGEWYAQDRAPLDIKGSILQALWLALFFLSVGQLTHWQGWLMAVGSLIFLRAFIKHSNHNPNPLIRLKLVWENRAFSRFLGASMMMYASNYGLMFLLGLYFQYNRELSATEAGQILLIQAIVQAILAPLAGRLSDRYQPRYFTVAGCLAGALGIGLLLMLGDQSPLYAYGLVFVLFGVSFGLFSTPNTSVAMASVSEQRLGIASALMSMGRLMGQMSGSALVSLLVIWFIGQQKITPALYADLSDVLSVYAAISLLFVLLAAWFSSVKITAVNH